MKINELNTPVLPDTYEASMFLNQTIRAGKYAIKIHNMIDNDQEMESWVAKKLDLASSYISSVGHYLEGQEMSEDAGEGHMAKSQMYKIAKYCLKISTLVKPGDDIEAWVQTKMNRAVDMLDAVYHYEDYQRLNPYREQLDSNIIQKHSQIVQKNIDEILARETPADDTETKPGMLNILKKRVHEVEKKMCREKTETISKKDVDKFHTSLDKLVHKSFGASSDEKKTTKEGIQQGFAVRYERDGKRLAQAYKTKDDAKKRASELKNMTGVKDISITQHTLNFKEGDVLDEGIKDWMKKLAAAGIIVGAVAGMGSINNAIDNSVPAIQAMNTAYEMAVDSGNDELAKMIKKDISGAKVRLSSGKDLNHIKYLQDKYSKFLNTESVNEYSMTKNTVDLIKQKQDKEAYQDKMQTLQQIQNNPHTNKDNLLKQVLMKRKEKLLRTGESKTVLYTNRLVDMMGKKLGESWTHRFKNSLKS